MVVANYKESDYASSGAISYFLRDQMIFVVAGARYPITTVGVGCGIGPVYLIEGGKKIYIGMPACGSTGASAGQHLEGPVLVPDYVSNVVLPDGGMLFEMKPPWISHFLGVISFVAIPLLPPQ